MADFKYKGTVGGVGYETKTFNIASGTAGTSTIGTVGTVDNGYWVKVADGGCAAAGRYALAVSDSTETAAAAGTVDAIFCPAGLVIQGKATTPANLSATVLFDKVSMDVSGGGVQTIDENDPSAAYGMEILSYDNTTDGNVQVVLPWLS